MKTTQAYFVQKMLAAVLARWPEWKQHLQTSHRHHDKGFWIVVPAPNKDVTRGLSISTDGRMIVVGFDDDHDHLNQMKTERLAEFRERVISRINDVLEDRLCATSWRANGILRTSCGFRTRNDAGRDFVEPGFACRVRSWSGQRDQDFIEN